MPVRVRAEQLCTGATGDVELVHRQPDPEATALEHVSDRRAQVRQFRWSRAVVRARSHLEMRRLPWPSVTEVAVHIPGEQDPSQWSYR